MNSMGVCKCLPLLYLLAQIVSVSCAAWHKGAPHKPYRSPECMLAPTHGRYNCSAGPWCPISIAMRHLVERGVAVPTVMADSFDANCTHLVSGCKVDSVGSQLHGKLSTYAYAQAKGLVYVHFPMVRSVGHFASEAEELKMIAELESFFNLGYEEMSVEEAAKKNVAICAVEHCHTFMDEGGESCYDSVKAEIRRKYDSSPKPAPLQHPTRITLAVHVRRGDIQTENGQPQPHHDLRFSPDQYYIDTLAAIKQSLPESMLSKLDILLLSEGAPSDFAAITNAHPTARLVLSGDVFQVIHTMVAADILVLSHSSFSYVAGLYNSGIVIYNHFWHSPPKAWLKNPWPPHKHDSTSGMEDAEAPCKLLMQRLNTPATHNVLENRWRIRNPQL